MNHLSESEVITALEEFPLRFHELSIHTTILHKILQTHTLEVQKLNLDNNGANSMIIEEVLQLLTRQDNWKLLKQLTLSNSILSNSLPNIQKLHSLSLIKVLCNNLPINDFSNLTYLKLVYAPFYAKHELFRRVS